MVIPNDNLQKQYLSQRPAVLSKRRGSVLIIALWSLFLLTTFALQLGIIVRQKITLAIRLHDRDNRFLIAEAGIERAMAELRKKDYTPETDTLNDNWSNNAPIFKDVSLGAGQFIVGYDYIEDQGKQRRYGLQDEESKINLNTAEVAIIANLFQVAAYLSYEEAIALAYNITDWRDADSFFQHPQYGAEDGDYEGLKRPYEAKDKQFEIPEELLLVKGMTQEIFERVSDFITVYGEGKININTAPREVFLALGITEKLADDILAFRKGADSLSGTSDDNFFSVPTNIVNELSQVVALDAMETNELSSMVERNHFNTKSDYFMIRSLAKLDKDTRGPEMKIMAVVDRKGRLKYWREKAQ